MKEKTGYATPPQSTRFPKGQSGNPKGRPKGSPSLATILRNTLETKTLIKRKGQRRRVTKLEAAIRHLVDSAAQGDLKALQFLAALLRTVPLDTEPDSGPPTLSDTDQKVMLHILKRFDRSQRGGSPGL